MIHRRALVRAYPCACLSPVVADGAEAVAPSRHGEPLRPGGERAGFETGAGDPEASGLKVRSAAKLYD